LDDLEARVRLLEKQVAELKALLRRVLRLAQLARDTAITAEL
jgi:uncharacterized protein YceH (UPF0502 family)